MYPSAAPTLATAAARSSTCASSSPGKELTPDNELNIITLNGIGSGTIWDHTQANVGFDDCNEWFGGTMNAKFMVVVRLR